MLALALECVCSFQWQLLWGFSFCLWLEAQFPALWKWSGSQFSDSLCTTQRYLPFHRPQMPHTPRLLWSAFQSQQKIQPCDPHFHPSPRCIISGMASGSIVLFYNDFNRWHHEYQTRYWWRQMQLGPVTGWSRKNSEHHSIEITITSECNLNLLEQAKYF